MSKPYRVCPDCGNHLDPGERCDCQIEREADQEAGRGAAQTAAQEATRNRREPVLMPGA